MRTLDMDHQWFGIPPKENRPIQRFSDINRHCAAHQRKGVPSKHYHELNKHVDAFTANVDVYAWPNCESSNYKGEMWPYLTCEKCSFMYTYMSHCGYIKP